MSDKHIKWMSCPKCDDRTPQNLQGRCRYCFPGGPRTSEPDIVYCESLGGIIDRSHLELMCDRHGLEFAIGQSVVLAPLETITRELWGATGQVESIDGDTGRALVRLTPPRKSVGVILKAIRVLRHQVLA